jgi:hypothetical protein
MSTVPNPPQVSNPFCVSCGHTAKDRSCSECGGGVPALGMSPCSYCLLRDGGIPVRPISHSPPEGVIAKDLYCDE